jgi:hypothetical protein
MSKRLAEDLATIMEFSTQKERLTFRLKLEAAFKYQVDMDVDLFDNKCGKSKNKKSIQFAEMLSSKVYTDYIKDPFNTETTMTYLRETLPCHIGHGLECNFDHSLPLYSIFYENLTYDVPYLEKQERHIDARHYNAYCIVPRLVYHISTKLLNETIHDPLGRDKKMKLIQSSLGMGKLQEPTLIVSFTELTESTPGYTTLLTSITVMTGTEAFQ